MKENAKPLMILFGFVAAVVVVFYIETKIFSKEKTVDGTITPKQDQQQYGEIKLIFEDFESVKDNNLDPQHIFAYGSAKISCTNENTKGKGYSGAQAVKINWRGSDNFGGWGKGIGHFFKLDPDRDRINFFVLYPEGKDDLIHICLQDDDNQNGSYEEDQDDAFFSPVALKPSPDWQLISIALKDLKDKSKGGDGVLNTQEGHGSLITVMIEFSKPSEYKQETVWYFDHLNISRGALPIGKDISDVPYSMANLYK